jgi:hypothetical protein
MTVFLAKAAVLATIPRPLADEILHFRVGHGCALEPNLR